MKLKILDTGKAAAQVNMDLDAALLKDLDDTPILHLYEWEGPSLTHGHFIKPEDHLDLAEAQKHNLAIAKRPTGGGMIFHVSDYAFSILIPAAYAKSTLENYQLINTCVQQAVEKLLDEAPELLPDDPNPQAESMRHFCMAKPTIYDVMLRGYKIAGAAQRRMRQGFLHQGSISLALPPAELLQGVLRHSEVARSMSEHTISLLGTRSLSEVRARIRELLTAEFTQRF